MLIQQGFLMWVGAGSDHFETKAEYIEEVRKRGISKRLPGLGMANALSEPGSVVYIAHDDGEAYSCDACLGQVECSACRVLQHKIDKWQEEANDVRKRYKSESDIPRGKARVIEIREERIKAARAEQFKCELCEGEGTYECGTGGYVELASGKRLDYRTYSYWVRQPHKFDVSKQVAADKTERSEREHMCEECGGTGKRPAAVVFAAFVPRIEVVTDGSENEIIQEHHEKLLSRDRTACLSEDDVAKEPPRAGRFSQRHAGYYAVATAGKPSKRALSVASQLTASRAVKGDTEVIGDIILFAKPVKVRGLKRFRAVKRFSLTGADERREMAAS